MTKKKKKLLQVYSKDGEQMLVDLKPISSSHGNWHNNLLDSEKDYGSHSQRLS